MTPKEKAKELVDKMYSKISNDMEKNPPEEHMISHFLFPEYMESAKQCALIAVDQVIEMLDVVCKGKGYDPFEAPMYDLEEWKQIKEEIEKL